MTDQCLKSSLKGQTRPLSPKVVTDNVRDNILTPFQYTAGKENQIAKAFTKVR